MKIAIDTSRAINEQAGIGRWTNELVKNMIEVDKENEYLLLFSYFRNDPQKEKIIDSFKKPNTQIKKIKIPGQLKEKMWGMNSSLYNKYYQDADVVLAPSFFEYKVGLKIPQVVIIYDMTTFLFPAQRGEEVSDRLSARTKLVCENSKKIIAISQNTKKDIVKLLKTPSNKIDVIYPGLTKFPKIVAKLPSSYKLSPKYYILFTGTIEPRKNFINLIKAHQLLPLEIRKKYPLVIAGSNGWNNQKEFENIKNDKLIKYLGRITDEILAKLYKDSTVFVYPSLYEGFGLPIIEAMQFGIPVITSNISSMPEAGGNVAFYIDPNNPKSIASKLQQIIDGKIDIKKISQLGHNQAGKFSWEKSAKQTIHTLAEVVNG